MDRLFDGLQLGWKPNGEPGNRQAFRCVCGRAVFFRNSQCVACGTALGYEPTQARLLPLVPGPDGITWEEAQADTAGGAPPLYRRCANFDSPAGCNWLIGAEEGATMCIACRLNRTIPDLSLPDNAGLWRRIETAKRRMVAQLLSLGLPVKSRVTEDPQQGLMFDLLRANAGASPVMTGHDEGLITLNVEEADDARREQIRLAMHEPYRTMLGHFRHEVGHYYWDRLVRSTDWLEPFRIRFGDEREDYAAALQRHYLSGPDPTWPQRCVSAYASTHPWEDWAETWAHYLHMVDTMHTALSFGVDGSNVELEIAPFTEDALDVRDDPDAPRFLQFLNAWVDLTAVLNELSRSMGQHDYYPFVLSKPAVAKLHFVHRLVTATRQLGPAVQTQPEGEPPASLPETQPALIEPAPVN
jgi:hypothetical protein